MVICQGIVREMSGNFEPTQMWQPCMWLQHRLDIGIKINNVKEFRASTRFLEQI